jgi:hypothetical protein
VGPAATTTDVEDDVDGGPPGARCRWVQQCPPLRLKKMPMVGPLGSCWWVRQRPPSMLKMSMAGPTASTIEVEDNVNGRPSRGALSVGPATSTTDVEDDTDGRPPGALC